MPYNDDFSVYHRDNGREPSPPVIEAGIVPRSGFKPQPVVPLPPPPRKTILISDYNNPNSDYNLRHNHSSGGRGNHIIGNVAAGSTPPTTFGAGSGSDQPNGGNGASQRPSHKTHVEIITKHGATKKPNIIGNNYHPPAPPPHDVLVVSTVNGDGGPNQSNNDNQQRHPNAPHGRSNANLDSADGPTTSARAENRKVTCMLYLQADHTFFGKMGSEEASIEAITRHVQRANVIYKGTGE